MQFAWLYAVVSVLFVSGAPAVIIPVDVRGYAVLCFFCLLG